MKIAFFTNTILEHGGGLEKYFIDTAVALADRYPESEISIITFNEKRTEMLQRILSVYYIRAMPIQNIYRENAKDILQKLGRVQYVKCASFKEVKNELKKADIIYSKNEIIDLAILKFFGYSNLPPVIAGVHTPIYYPIAVAFHSKLHNFLYGGFVYAFLMNGLCGVHVTNQSNVEIIKKTRFSGKVEKIFNPFPYQETIIARNETSEFRILFVGRISREKGVDLFIDCMQGLSLRKDFSIFQFRIAGSGDPDLIEKLKVLKNKYENVEYVGHVPNAEINGLYAWTDVVVIPSHFETASYVALEAGINGKIALASDIPGPQDIIENEKTGYLLPLSTRAFVDKIGELSMLKKSDPESFYQVGVLAQEHIKKFFDPEILYTRFYTVLSQCAKITGIYPGASSGHRNKLYLFHFPRQAAGYLTRFYRHRARKRK